MITKEDIIKGISAYSEQQKQILDAIKRQYEKKLLNLSARISYRVNR